MSIVKIKYDDVDQTFNDQGWFCATDAAKRYGKRPNDWVSLPETQRYIEALVKRAVGKSDTVKSGITDFVKTKKGNSRLFTQGTWLHPKLAVRFAQWLDVDFAVWCDEQIDNLIRTNQAPPSVQDMMRLMLLPSASTWEKRFPDSFYKALAKVTGTKFNSHIGGTPAIFGDLTNKWVYRIIMPKEALVELRSNKRDGEKMHQWLTNGGEQLLSDQIKAVEIIANSSSDLADFTSRCFQAFTTAKGQLRLVLPERGCVV